MCRCVLPGPLTSAAAGGGSPQGGPHRPAVQSYKSPPPAPRPGPAPPACRATLPPAAAHARLPPAPPPPPAPPAHQPQLTYIGRRVAAPAPRPRRRLHHPLQGAHSRGSRLRGRSCCRCAGRAVDGAGCAAFRTAAQQPAARRLRGAPAAVNSAHAGGQGSLKPVRVCGRCSGGARAVPEHCRCRLRCAIPSRSLHGQRPKRRRCTGGALLYLIKASRCTTACAAGAAAPCARRCPCDSRRGTWWENAMISGCPGAWPAVRPQVRAAAAATTRRGCQRGGAVYEKERESKAETQKRSAASTAADQSTRRGGWRPVGCGAAHEQ